MGLSHQDKLKGMRTASKLFVNVVERLEAMQRVQIDDDWRVGVQCSSISKAVYVYDILKSLFDACDIYVCVALKEDKMVIEVAPLKIGIQSYEEYRDKQELSKSDVSKHGQPESPDSVSSSSSSIGGDISADSFVFGMMAGLSMDPLKKST